MLSGFNTNFRYRGVLFHVQTEDSGLENPHVITHLFHGGNIMASVKRDYSELIVKKEGDDLEGSIRKLMEEMHKSMLKQLSRGEHDEDIEARMGPDVFRVEAPPPTPEPPTVTEEEAPPPPEAVSDAPTVAEQTVLEEPTQSGIEETQPVSRLSKVFGERVVSEKPLDEVVLDYLVENARKRKRSK